MSASFYDLLKFAKTGIASPSMTYYDKQKALAMCKAGFPVKTLTGVPPISFQSDGTALTAWSISGNMVQTGTPTPSAPIQPEECGDKTANLFDKSAAIPRKVINSSTGEEVSSYSTRLASDFIAIFGETVTLTSNQGGNKSGAFYDSNKVYISGFTSYGIITVPTNARYMRFTAIDTEIDTIMLNTGSTAQPYEPYGYKIPITNAGQTQTVYLGEVPTVRRVRKLVLTGDEEYMQYAGGTGVGIRITVDDMRIPSYVAQRAEGYCTHFVPTTAPSGSTGDNITFGTSSNIIYMILSVASQQALNVTTYDEFKAWIAAEYAAGHPVTIWYVLAEPEACIVNEPLCKISTYADELNSTDAGVSIPTAKGQNVLTVETELQPSEMSITGHIKSN